MKQILGIFGIIVLTLSFIVSPFSASAQNYQQIVPTDVGTVKVGITTEPSPPKPNESTKLKIDFLNPQTNEIQEHIDYSVTITKDGDVVFGPIPLTHTSIGTVTIPVKLKDGNNQVVISVEGILFRPIQSEKATFFITTGEKHDSFTTATPQTKDVKNKETEKAKPKETPHTDKNNPVKKDSKSEKKTDKKKDLKIKKVKTKAKPKKTS